MVNRAVYHTVSMAEDVANWLNQSQHVHVLNRFDKACNLINEHGAVISIVTAEIGNGPLNMVLPVPALPPITEGTVVHCDHAQLIAPSWVIHTDKAALWDATLPPADNVQFQTIIQIAKQVLRGYPDSLAQPYLLLPASESCFQNTVLRHIAEAAALVLKAIANYDDVALVAAVTGLAGKGFGLTPSGDDWLLGCLVALHLTKRHDQAQLMAQESSSRTTPLSGAILHMAGQRKCSQPWHALVHAKTTEQTRTAIKIIARHGHSSGADALTGFVQMLECLSQPTFTTPIRTEFA